MDGSIKWQRKGAGQVCGVRESEGVPYLYFPHLECGPFVHGFSTRLGGVSEGDLATMNLSFQRGDATENVRENYARIARAIGFCAQSLVLTDQTHTANVRVAVQADAGSGFSRPVDHHGVDGLVTNVPGLVLAALFADCVPIFAVDPIKNAVGLAHAGWRGTVSGIGKVTVDAMRKAFGSRPQDLRAAIGPSICQDCYEVGTDVADAFRGAFPAALCAEILRPNAAGKYQLDLWRANAYLLQDAGIPETQICVTDICTCCNPKLLFSHRASKGKRGNLAAFLGIRAERGEICNPL